MREASSPLNPYRVYHLLWSGLDLLFPPACGGCGSPGCRWCTACAASVVHPAEPLCAICGVPVAAHVDLCPLCEQTRPGFHLLRSWSRFEGPVRNALHRLKYRRDLGLGDALASQICAFVGGLEWPIDLVVPVPLGRNRLRERGYNQVSLIARPLSMAIGIAYAPNALMRQRETRSQVGLTRAERRENVLGAFRVTGQRVQGRSILLVDDVATTGSTLSSCATALYAAGAQDVFAFTIARAISRHEWANA